MHDFQQYNTNEAKEKLMKSEWKIPQDKFLNDFIKMENTGQNTKSNLFVFTEIQAKSILEIRLSKLTNLERTKLIEDLEECVRFIKEYLSILSSYKLINFLKRI